MGNVWQRWDIKKKKNGRIKRAVRTVYIKIRREKIKEGWGGGKGYCRQRQDLEYNLFHWGRSTSALEFAIARFHEDAKARPEAERVYRMKAAVIYRAQRYKREEDTDSESLLDAKNLRRHANRKYPSDITDGLDMISSVFAYSAIFVNARWIRFR